jgi:hypothetical protein
MRRIFQKRWLTLLMAVAWFSAAAIQDLAPALSALVPETKTGVEAAVIEMPGKEHATCHHHPQGCPANCLCAKTTVPVEDARADILSGDPAWVECSEARAVSAPAFAVYLPEIYSPARLFESSEAFATPGSARARDPFRSAPFKVPLV